jgi:hypothetical protein
MQQDKAPHRLRRKGVESTSPTSGGVEGRANNLFFYRPTCGAGDRDDLSSGWWGPYLSDPIQTEAMPNV